MWLGVVLLFSPTDMENRTQSITCKHMAMKHFNPSLDSFGTSRDSV